MLKNLPANAGDIRDMGLIPESGRSSGGGHDNHSSTLAWRIPMDRGAWWATVHGVAKSGEWLRTHTERYRQRYTNHNRWISLMNYYKRKHFYVIIHIRNWTLSIFKMPLLCPHPVTIPFFFPRGSHYEKDPDAMVLPLTPEDMVGHVLSLPFVYAKPLAKE